MVELAAIDADPVNATAGIVEDEEQVVTNLLGSLRGAGLVVTIVARNYNEFTSLILPRRFDTVSLDWQLDDIRRGKTMLDAIGRHDPRPGIVVFSKYDVERDAYGYGADEFLLKPAGGDVAPCVSAMKNAAKLGLGRAIAFALTQLQVAGVPAVGRRCAPNDTEQTLFALARGKAITSGFPRQKMPELIDLLVRRGWWRTFDPTSFAALPILSKLRTLTRYAELSPDDLKTILGPDAKAAAVAALEDFPAELTMYRLTDEEDGLLSVLGHLLWCSGYEPDIVPHLLRNQDTVKGCPWETSTLLDYLLTGRRAAVREATMYVRRW